MLKWIFIPLFFRCLKCECKNLNIPINRYQISGNFEELWIERLNLVLVLFPFWWQTILDSLSFIWEKIKCQIKHRIFNYAIVDYHWVHWKRFFIVAELIILIVNQRCAIFPNLFKHLESNRLTWLQYNWEVYSSVVLILQFVFNLRFKCVSFDTIIEE